MEESQEKGLESLKVWQRALAFAKEICLHALPLLPAQEKWSLDVQLRRGVQSVPANIAEGYGRYYYQESIRLCYIARGSLEETYSHMKLAHELGYLPQPDYERDRRASPHDQRLHIFLEKKQARIERTWRRAYFPRRRSECLLH